MKSWTPKPPTASTMGDHDVPTLGQNLAGKRIALLVCGGIAAMKAPMLARALRRYGAEIVAYVSEEATRYVTVDTLEWATNTTAVTRLTPRSEHLSKSAPFDAYLIAPATYNTINKFRFGVADTPITSTLASALGLMERGETQILLAPTMHGDMHNSIVHESLAELSRRGVILIPPRDDYGKHNFPENDVIVAYACAAISKSPLKGQRILLTAGPTPTPIDNVRNITNRFRGRLGIEIAKELALRGADVKLILGAGSVSWPDYIDTEYVADFDAYRAAVLKQLEVFKPAYGIFSAAVADYAPKTRFAGKIPSDGTLQTLDLVPTEKIINLVRAKAPQMGMISFKYQENISHEQLMTIAKKRLELGHLAVVANRGEETGPKGEQIAHLLSASGSVQKLMSKAGIAVGICDFLETQVTTSKAKTLEPATRGNC